MGGVVMTTFDGVVTLEDTDIPVIIGLDDGEVRLVVDGKEVASWAPGECSILGVDDGVYTINAENESLRFVPSDPALFELGVNGASAPAPAEEMLDIGAADIDRPEPPEPRPVTMAMFYGLSALTALLGLWALLSLIF